MVYQIGNGSGTLKLPLGLQPGDMVGILTGSYQGIKLSGLNGVTFFPVNGPVTFISSPVIGATKNLHIDGTGIGAAYGFKYQFAKVNPTDVEGFSVFVSTVGGDTGLIIEGFDGGNTAGTFVDSQTKIWIANKILTWDGINASTTAFTNLTLNKCRVGGKTSVHAGTFESASTYRMVNIGCQYNNILVENDGTGGTQKINGNSHYLAKAKNWLITGLNVVGQADVGVFYISGNITLDGIIRLSGYGYIIRLIQIGFASNQDSTIQNCIDCNTTHYGTGDLRLDKTALNGKASIPLLGGNISFINNTCGNKKDDGSYVTNAVVLGDMADETGKPFKMTIKNNFTYNAAANGGSDNSSLLKQNGNPATQILDMSNNVDLKPGVPLPPNVYIKDEIKFIPVVNGPLVKTGVVTTNLYDVYGILRTNPPDIGAAQSIVVNKPPIVVAQGSITTLPVSSASLSGIATDSDGTITSTAWTQDSGPNQAVIAAPTSLSTAVSGLIVGNYVFRLTATDNSGANTFAFATVVVNPQPVIVSSTSDFINKTVSLTYSDGSIKVIS